MSQKAGIALRSAWAARFTLLLGLTLISLANLSGVTWNTDTSANWGTDGNWSAAHPNAVDAVADFGNIITADRIVTLDAGKTVGTVTFDDGQNYTVSGANTLTFDVSAGSAAITVNTTNGNGAHTIASNIALSDDIVITNGSTGTFTLSGIISGAQEATFAGSGTTLVSGANTHSNGSVVSGTGTTVLIGNDAAFGTGSLSLGGTSTIQANGAARTLANNITLLAGGTVTVDGSEDLTLDGIISGGANLVKNGTGTLTLNGNNTNTNSSSSLYLEGNTWKKIDYSYTITASTVLEYDFKSTAQGEIHGIGFDTDNNISANRTFKNYGTQNWGITTYNNYSASAPNTVRYTIPIGTHYTGAFDRLFFTLDHDVGSPTANGTWSNIQVHEGTPGSFLDLTAYTIDSYGGSQDANQVSVDTETVGTTVNAGTLALGHDNALGTAKLDMAGGTLTAVGGARTITNAMGFKGDFTIGGSQNITWSGTVELDNDTHTVTVTNTGTTEISGVISSGGFTKAGTGKLTLSGDNDYEDATVISAGTLEIEHVDGLGDSGSATTTTVASGATLELDVTGTIDNENLTISGTGNSSAGVIDHTGAVATTISGTVTMAADSTIDVSHASGTLTLSGVIGESGGARALTKTGSGTLVVGAAATYTGDTTISAGTLQLSTGNDRLPTGTDVSIAAGATLDLNARSQEIAGLTGAGTVDNTSATGATLTVDITAGTNTFTGNITETGGGDVGLTKQGAGTLVLTSSGHTMAGDVTVEAGTLQISGGGDLVTADDLHVADSAGQTATMIITGAGTTFTANNPDDLGGNASGFSIGNGAGSTGTLNITDSAVADSDGQINLGRNGGHGVLLVDNATLTVTDGDADLEAAVENAASTATVTIQNNASVDVDDDIILGRLGTATMTIQTGADVATDDLLVGFESGGNGTIIVTGSGSTLTARGGSASPEDVDFGRSAGDSTALLRVEDGGIFTTNTISEVWSGGTIDLGSSGSGTVNGTGTIRNNSGGVIKGNGTISNAIDIEGGSFSNDAMAEVLNLTGIISDSDAGNESFTKNGDGTVVLGGASANTYGGSTIINAGVLALDKDSAGTDAVAGDITVAAGATLELRENNQIANGGDLTLSGGTFDTGGFDETLTNLTLTYDSVIDMGAGDSILTFTGTVSGLTSHTLSIWNWSGNPYVGGGTDQLIFSGDVLNSTELGNISIYSDAGTTLFALPRMQFSGEVVPAPEPSTWLTAFGLLALGGWHWRRKFLKNKIITI